MVVALAACLASAQVYGFHDPAPVVAPLQATRLACYSSQSWLGVGIAELTSTSRARLQVASENGAEVVEVYPDSPAASAGVKTGDVITRFDGERVISVRQLERLVSEVPANRTVAVAVMRAGKPLQLAVHLAARSGTRAYAPYGRLTVPPIAPHAPPLPRLTPMPPAPPAARGLLRERLMEMESLGNLGVTVETLTPQLAEYFGVKKGQGGLLVRSVEAESAAGKAGMAAGDVLTRLGDTRIGSMRDLQRATRAAAGTTVTARLLRRGKVVRVAVAVPRRSEGWM
ncbi:MAG TPA: PDZ domain-containing protein [Terriglobales bacterium]|nr:PDZ domain-containing protein [Terriglobales bacterium]